MGDKDGGEEEGRYDCKRNSRSKIFVVMEYFCSSTAEMLKFFFISDKMTQNCQHINCTNAKFLVWHFSVIRCQHWRILVKGYIGPFLLSFPTSFESIVILKYKRRKRNELLIHVILSVNIITVS